MENNQINNSYVPLADEAFLSLGAQQIAYVKAINLPDGAHAFGIYSADGKPRNYSQLAAIQIGSFLDAGALAWHADESPAGASDKGCMAVDYDRLPAAVAALEQQVLQIKGRADRKAAEGLKARYVDAQDGFAAIKSEIATRYLRAPKATFVYSVVMP